MAFFELRQYQIRHGKMKEWLTLLEQEIIPFQVSVGMVICGSFRSEEDDSSFIWLRRFESESHREALYAAVYETDIWQLQIAPKLADLLEGEMIVKRVLPTSLSPLQ